MRFPRRPSVGANWSYMCSTNTLGQSLGKKPWQKLSARISTYGWRRNWRRATSLRRWTSIQHVDRILNFAVQWGYLDTNPFKAVVIKKLPTGDYMQRFLTHTEIKSLLSACKRSTHPFLHLFVKLLLLTGARKSELRLAKWTCIDLQNGELFVAVSKSGRSRTVSLSKKA